MQDPLLDCEEDIREFLAEHTTTQCPPLLAQAMEYAVFPGGARVRPQLCMAVALANNTRYGLASSIWTENINLALEMAPKIACGVVWVNGANFFDAAAGFGGRRESGFGREGGRERRRHGARLACVSRSRSPG